MIFTHFHEFESFNNSYISPVFLPFAYNHKEMSNDRKKHLKDRKYDLYFSGILQNWNHKNLQSDLQSNYNFKLIPNNFYKGNIIKREKHYFLIGKKLKI